MMLSSNLGGSLRLAAALLAAALAVPVAAQTTLGDGAALPPTSICPLPTPASVDAFTLVSTGADEVRIVRVGLYPAGAYRNVAKVEVRSDDLSVLYGSIAPQDDYPILTLATRIPVDATVRQYRLVLTPRNHADMPPPAAGLEIPITARVSSVVGNLARNGSDPTSTTLTIDNQSPADPRLASVSTTATSVTLNWATSQRVLVLRSLAGPVTEAPTEAVTSYGATIGASAVAFNGTAASYNDAGLTTGKPYYYRLFTVDACGNWSTGAALGPIVPGGVAAGDLTPNSLGPVVGILNPGGGGATSPFRVQVRVFSPSSQAIGLVQLEYDNGTTKNTVTLSRNANYGSAADSGVWETAAGGLTLPAGRYTLRASAANATKTVWSNPVGVSVTAGKGDGNLLVRDNSEQLCTDCHAYKTHSSEAAGNQYGSWYAGCRTCHTPHGTTNAALIANEITPPPVNGVYPPSQVVFSKRTGFSATGGAALPAEGSFANADGTGPCQVCHTRTSAFRRDGTLTSHNPNANCSSCHAHTSGLQASCSGCHGTPGRASIAGADALQSAAPPVVAPVPAVSVAGGGVHLAHVNQITYRAAPLACAECHETQAHDGITTVDWGALALTDSAVAAPAAGDVAAWVSAPSCTNYCHGATLADGFSATKVTASWIDGATPMTCGACHGNPPDVAPHTAGMTDCAGCHPAGYSPTTVNAGEHIDGTVDAMACNGCHGDPARVPVAGATTDVQNAPPKSVGGTTADPISTRGVGLHQVHVNDATIVTNPIGCAECHQSFDATHPQNDGEGDVTWGPLANQLGTANWNGTSTCSNVYCHNPTPASPGTVPAPTFFATNNLGCVGCHDDAASLTTNAHEMHVADAGYKGTTYGCVTCHSNATNSTITDKSLHVDGAANTAGTTFAAGACASNYCHSDGTETPGYVSANWASGSVGGTCVECHGRDVGSIAGAPWYANVTSSFDTRNSHAKHVAAATDCVKCHATTVQASGALIAAGTQHIDSTRDVSPGGGASFSYDEATETCSSISCHGGKTATWGDTLGCAGCHGDAARSQVATTVDVNFRSAPPVDAAGASTGVKVGAHVAHTNSSTYREGGLACADCHPAAVSHNGTRDAAWSTLATGGGAVTPTPAAGSGSYSSAWESTPTCTNYCHGASLQGGTNTSPSWTATGMTCTSCHGTTGLTSGGHELHVADAGYKGTTFGCVTCHSNATNSTITNKALHVDAGVNTAGTSFAAGACASNYCHSDGTETPGYVSANWLSGAAGGTCVECHGRDAGSIAGAPWYANVTSSFDTRNSHPKHVAAATDCVKCHATTVQASGALIAAGTQHLDTTRDVSAGGGASFSYNEGTETCSSISCHGGKTATWGDTLGCAGCHGDGARVKAIAGTVDANFQSAPPVDTAGASTGVKVGAHLAHVNSATYRADALACADCHPAAVSHNGTRDAAWSTLATGNGTVTPTPAAGSGAYSTAWESTPTCSNYCHGDGMADGFTLSKVVANWNATSAPCGSCHGVPPNLAPHSSGMTDCGGCHPAGYSLTTVNAGTHIDGTLDAAGCNGCHGDPTRTPVALATTDVQNAPPKSVGGTTADPISTRGVGLHQLHVNDATIVANPIACAECHQTADASHPQNDGEGDVTWGPLANQLGTASWNGTSTCTNVYCHNPTPATPGTVPAPTFFATNNLGCVGCHDDAASLTTNAHEMHVADAGGYKGQTYTCDRCHTTANNTTILVKAQHVDGTAQYTASACDTCHNTGTESPTIVTPAWNTGTVGGTCIECHGREVGSIAGAPWYANGGSGTATANSHASHLKTGDGTAACYWCHNTTVSSTGVINAANHLDFSPAATPDVSSTFFTYNATTETCTSITCHGGGTAVWGSTTNIACTTCHDNGTAAPSIVRGPLGTQTGTNTRRDIVAEFGQTWSHKRNASPAGNVIDADCVVCHMEGEKTTVQTAATHADGLINLRDPDSGANIKNVTWNNGTPGAYTPGTTDVTFARFERNLAVRLENETAANFQALTATMVHQCLNCHDSDGATNANAQVAGGSAAKPFNTTVSYATWPVASGGTTTLPSGTYTAGGTSGGVIDVATSFATTNSSYHPVLGKQNNWYAKTTRMVAPWNVARVGTANNTTWGGLMTCWDCHADSSVTTNAVTLTTTVTAHGGGTTVRGAPTYTGTVTLNLTTALSSGAVTLCIRCHAGYDTSTISSHNTGSALSGTTNNTMTSFLRYACNRCHSSGFTTPVVRPVRAEDSHGFNRLSPTDQRWPTGGTESNYPYAFIRNTQSLSNHTVLSVGGTAPSPSRTCVHIANGACNSRTETYSPGGVY